uniref:Mitochondrial inner membrane protein Mpv17 n=1 Tax=Glossina brevipalpis TaxID=37001 RepID=A0A1A9WB08_9MUSC
MQCGAIMGIGDLMAQAFGNQSTFEDIDRLRTIKYATIGLIVGPFLGVWYTFLDRHVSRKDSRFKRALKKTAYDQLLLAPILTLTVIPLIGILNRQSLQCGAIMGTGDILAQTVTDKRELKQVDFKRTLKYASLGIFYVGPILKGWYKYLELLVPEKDTKFVRASKKMLIDQAIMAPLLNLTLVPLVGVVMNQSYDEIKKHLKYDYPEILKRNYMLWPAVQLINFGFIPLQFQVLFVQVIAVAWNFFLSGLLNKNN